MSTYYFAWVDASETTFVEGTHAREDESVFSFTLSQSENDFAVLEVDIVNPQVGLLAPEREQWAWLSRDGGGSAGVEPLFFGRVIGIPTEIEERVVRLSFVARPADYEAQKAALADTMREPPFYDPVWLNLDQLDDPDTVLEARPALWHTHRVTHALVASDLLQGSGNTYDVYDHFADSLGLQWSQRPVNLVRVKAEVRWDQNAIGSVDITEKLCERFVEEGSSQGPSYITSYTGEAIERLWPTAGKRIGSGWSVGQSELERVDGRGARQMIQPIKVEEPYNAAFPLWTFKPTLFAAFDVSRSRVETVEFSFTVGVQPLYSETSSEDVLDISLVSTSIQEPVDDGGSAGMLTPLRYPYYRSYFLTDRGIQSIVYLVCLARSRALYRARAAELTFQVALDDVIGVTCNDNATIYDDMLPGGSATGKVVYYALSLDGDVGSEVATVTIACTLGQGGVLEVTPGEPTYVDEDYVEDDYQTFSGGATAVAGDIAYDDFGDTPIVDDGIEFGQLNADNAVLSVDIVGGQTEQEAALTSRTFEDISDATNELNNHYTEVGISFLPLKGGPFQTDFALTVSSLVVPKTLDLEIGASS